MNRFCIKCPTCGHPVDAELYNRGQEAIPCAVCKTKITVYALPALYKPQEKSSDAVPAGFDDAVCFYHEGKKAEQVCDDCGRFLCGLCVLPIEEQILCTSCLEQRRKGDGMRAMKPREMRYDKLAVLFAAFSVACIVLATFFVFAVIPCSLGLIAIYVIIRRWKTKPELAGGFRFRMILALLFSCVGIVGGILVGMNSFKEIFGV